MPSASLISWSEMTEGARIGDDSTIRPKSPMLSPFAVWMNQFGFANREDLLFLSAVPRRSSAFPDQHYLQVCARHFCQPCSWSLRQLLYSPPTESVISTQDAK